MKTIITSAFSINMLQRNNIRLQFTPLALERARAFFEPGYTTPNITPDFESAVGHPDTAAVFSDQLGIEVKANRINVQLDHGTRLLVGQYTGPRLPEGATSLPDDATILWWLVTIA